MKTLENIKADIKTAMLEIEAIRKNKLKGERTIISRLAILKKAKNYLEFNPEKQHAVSQLDFAKKCVLIHNKRYQYWLNENPKRKDLENPHTLFIESNGIDTSELKKKKQEIKFLNYILS